MVCNWSGEWSSFAREAVPSYIGGIAVLLETLKHLRVVMRYKQRWDYSNVEKHIRRGSSTYPFYTFNGRGGWGLEIDWNALSAANDAPPQPPLDLYWSYEAQLTSHGIGALEAASVDDLFTLTSARLSEQMIIDSWLCFVGSKPEEVLGRGELHIRTPFLVEEILNLFYGKWAMVERFEFDGGYQKLAELAGRVKDRLRTKELSKPEEIVVVVACLRALKMVMLHLVGANVYEARELLERDFPAYLV